jgi:hypothetical protein
MRSVDTLVSSNTLLDKMSTHLNGLLRQDEEPQVDKAVILFDKLFANADKAMSSDSDKQVLSVLKRQVSSFIGVTLGVKPFLDPHENQQDDSDDDDDDTKPGKLSWSSASEKEKNSRWSDAKAYYDHNKTDIYSPEKTEHEHLRQILEEEHYGRDGGSGEEENDEEDEEEGDSDEYEEVVEQVQVKSREIGGAGGFEVVRRRQKKKKTKTTITTNFTYSHSTDNNAADNYNNNSRPYYKQPPRQRVRIIEFRPHMLEHLPCGTFCMPLFFPSEESYSVRFKAMSMIKKLNC